MHAHAALSLCLGLALASSSLATVTANRYDSTGTLIASHTWTPSIPQEFEITVGSSDATVYIFQSNVNDDIPLLKLKQTSGSTSNAIQVYVAQESYDPGNLFFESEDVACHNLGGFETERPNVAFSCYVGNELGQGGVVASHVRLVQTDGAISGPITQGLSSSDAYGAGKGLIVITGGQDDAAPIEAKAGFIALVQGVSGTGATSGLGGDLKGDIKATATSSGGWIESIISDGTVGQFQGTTPTISAATRNPSTDLHIAVLSAYECAANIPAGSASAPAMDVGDIEITHHFGRTSAFAIIGEFNQFSVGGNVRGEVYLNDGVPSDKTVQIGLTLYGNLRLPANGLEGQVIINQQNATGQWSGAGHIYLASTELVEEYSTLPSAIGGGAAGMAPFVLHEVASEPDQDGFVSNGEVDIEDPELACEKIDFTPEIELYGQVALSGDIDDRVNVEVWNGSAWTTAGFDLETTLVSNGTSRRLRLQYPGSGLWPGGDYRITPKTGKITCTDVLGNPTADFEYRFTVLDGCELMMLSSFDLNNDDTLCAGDIAEWTLNPVDFNNDSAADGDDATLLINAVNAYNN